MIYYYGKISLVKVINVKNSLFSHTREQDKNDPVNTVCIERIKY